MSPPRVSENLKSSEYFIKKDLDNRQHLYMTQRKSTKNEHSFITNMKNKYKDLSAGGQGVVNKSKEESKFSINTNSIQFNNSINITNIILNDEVNKSMSKNNRIIGNRIDSSTEKSPKKKLVI